MVYKIFQTFCGDFSFMSTFIVFPSLGNQDGFIKYAPGENYHAYDRGVDMDIFIKDSGGVDDLIGNVSIISITFPFTFFITNIMIVHRNNKDHYYVSVTF